MYLRSSGLLRSEYWQFVTDVSGPVARKRRYKIRVQLKCDGIQCRTGGEVNGKLENRVGSQHPSHYLGTCIQHYYCCCAHLGCQ